MDLASKALEGNSLPKIRAALEAVYALQFQTVAQRQRKAARQPGIARCESCGKPVSVRRRPRLGEPVYCRRSSTCRVHAFRARRRAEAGETETAGQIPESAREGAQETPRLLVGNDLSAAMRVG
jgi:hypothetical protein